MVAQTLHSENKPIIISEKVKIYGKSLAMYEMKKKSVFFLFSYRHKESSIDHESNTVYM